MKFKRIYIEITNQCNLSCSFCIQKNDNPRYMNIEQFMHIINQIKPYTNHIYLHVLGEPLLHPKLNDFLDIANKNNIEVNITTNATLLSKVYPTIRNHPIRQFNISLHSFESQIDSLKYLHSVFQTCQKIEGTYINYRLWNLGSDTSNQDVFEIIKQYYQMDLMGASLSRIQLKKNHFLHFESQFIWPSLHHPIVKMEGSCLGARDMCAILSDGSVVPCCFDTKADIHFGNIFEEDFKDIITSLRFTNMVKGFQNRMVHEELCKRCTFRSRFD